MADPSAVDPGDYINMPGSSNPSSDLMAMLVPQPPMTLPAATPASAPTGSPAIQAVIAGQAPLQAPATPVPSGQAQIPPGAGTALSTPGGSGNDQARMAAPVSAPAQSPVSPALPVVRQQLPLPAGNKGASMAPPTTGQAQPAANPAQATATPQAGSKPGLSIGNVISAVKGALTGSNPSQGPMTANGAKPNPNDYTMGAWEKRNPILAIGAVLAGLHSRGGLEFASSFVKQEQNQLNDQYNRDLGSYQITQEAQARSQEAQQRSQQMTMEEGRASQEQASQKQEQGVHDLLAGSELYSSLAKRSPADQEAGLKAINASDPGMLARMGLPPVADMYDKTTGKFMPLQTNDDKQAQIDDKAWSGMWSGASKIAPDQLGNYFQGFNDVAMRKFGVPITDPRFGLYATMPDGSAHFSGMGMTTAQQQGQERIDQGNARLALSKVDSATKQTDTTKREAVDQVYRYSKMVLNPMTARMPAPQQYQFVLDPLRTAMVNAGMLPSDAPRLPLVKVNESPSDYLAERRLMDTENQDKFSDSLRMQEFDQAKLNKATQEGWEQAHFDMAKANKATSDARQLWNVANDGYKSAQKSFMEAQSKLNPSDPLANPPTDKPNDPVYSNLMKQEADASATMAYYQGQLDHYNGILYPKVQSAPPPAPPTSAGAAPGQNTPDESEIRPLPAMPLPPIPGTAKPAAQPAQTGRAETFKTSTGVTIHQTINSDGAQIITAQMPNGRIYALTPQQWHTLQARMKQK